MHIRHGFVRRDKRGDVTKFDPSSDWQYFPASGMDHFRYSLECKGATFIEKTAMKSIYRVCYPDHVQHYYQIQELL